MNEERKQINSYWLDQALANGPFTTTYRSSHSRESRLQAVTKLPINQASETLILLAARLDICSSFGKQAGNQYIQECIFFQHSPLILQFRYASGSSLAQKLRQGEALDAPFAIKALREIAVALDYAHKHQIIHGNLKPENILFSEQQEVRLSDFSVPHPSFPYYHLVLRTLSTRYPAIEFIEGRISPASDQFQLAQLAYEWLSGQLARRYSSGRAQAYVPITAWPNWDQIRPVFNRATASGETQRYPDMLTFATELGKACGVEPTGPLHGAPTRRRFSPTMVLRAVSVLLLLVMIAGGGLLLGQGLRKHLTPALTPTSTVSTAQALYIALMRTQPTEIYFAHGQNSGQWSTFQHLGGDSCLFRDGALHLTTDQKGASQYTTCVLQGVSAVDVAFQADITFVRMQPLSLVESGLGVRVDQRTEDGYVFYLDTLMYQSNFLPQVTGSAHLYPQSTDAPSAHHGLNASNTLTIIARKDMFYLYINGTPVDTEQDTQFQSGQLELYLASEVSADVAYQNVKVWLL